MSTMQVFYSRLFHAVEATDPDLAPLTELTKVSPDQVQALKTNLSWSHWPTTVE